MMKRNPAILVILFINVLLFTQCGPVTSPPRYQFWFGIYATPTPYHLDYAVHDTLWVSITSTDKSLYDTISGKRYRFDSTGFTSALSVKDAEYKYPGNDEPAASFIYPENIVGATLHDDSSSTAEVTYGCASPNYSLNIGIVLLHNGVFNISFTSKHVLDCPNYYNEVENATYHFIVNDTHLSYYQQLPWDSLGRQPDNELISQLQNKTSFIVHVR